MDDNGGPGQAGRAGSVGGSGHRHNGGPGRPRTAGPAPRPGRGGRALRIGAAGLLAAVVVGVLLVLTLGGSVVDLITDGMWYQSVGYAQVLWTRLGAQLVLFFGVGIAVLVLLLVDLWIAARLAPPPTEGSGSFARLWERLNQASRYASGPRVMGPFGPSEPIVVSAEDLPDLTPVASWTLVGIAVLAALTAAGVAAGAWDTVLLWVHRVPFSPTGQPVTDPIFHRDISFFLFELPFWQLVQGLANGVLLAAIVIAAARHLVTMARGRFSLSRNARLHLGVLGALWLLTIAAGYQLDRLNLTHSTQGVATGVSYTDQAARFFAYDALTIVAVVVAIVVVLAAIQRRWWPVPAALGTWFVLSIALAGIYPGIVQRFTVQPNEYAVEQPYIQNNITMTRLAYGLDQWQVQPYQGAGELTQSAIQADATTFANARLWDYRPLSSTIDQLQTVRQYYTFMDVDADRYQINGQERQVWVSAREIAPENNPSAQSWVNQHITYTHGIGAVMAPVNEVTNEGLPQLLIRDLPPVSTGGAPQISQPRIYFGEKQNTWVVVDAASQEFDYPLTTGTSGAPAGSETGGTGQVYTKWQGSTGIGLGSPLTRLLFALRFRDLNILISDQVAPNSQLLFRRSLAERLPLMAPFLHFDKDPYLVITDQGRLAYVQDAYTTSADFPNAQAIDPSTLPAASGLQGDPFDYVRNSVKIVMDANDGTTTMYVSDPADPILRAWEGVFPGMFQPQAAMPAWLRAHLRYPEDLFDVQTRMYATYHVTDTQTFYRQDDLWTVPQEPTSTQQLPLEAYYVEMRMPGAAAPEFLLLQPMIPAKRPNMSSWIAARMDGASYGKVVVYGFPRDTSILGPAQIEGRIDQDPTISSQLTLWDQSGSTVIRGNLIVVPVQDSLLYLEPIYLQSTSIQFPEFQRIVVASPTKVAWGSSLTEALNALLAATPTTPGTGPGASTGPGGSPAPAGSPAPGASVAPSPSTVVPGQTPPSGDVKALVAYANAHFEAAQAALRAGDFARYGQEIALVKAALSQLSVLTGAPTPPASQAP